MQTFKNPDVTWNRVITEPLFVLLISVEKLGEEVYDVTVEDDDENISQNFELHPQNSQRNAFKFTRNLEEECEGLGIHKCGHFSNRAGYFFVVEEMLPPAIKSLKFDVAFINRENMTPGFWAKKLQVIIQPHAKKCEPSIHFTSG